MYQSSPEQHLLPLPSTNIPSLSNSERNINVGSNGLSHENSGPVVVGASGILQSYSRHLGHRRCLSSQATEAVDAQFSAADLNTADCKADAKSVVTDAPCRDSSFQRAFTPGPDEVSESSLGSSLIGLPPPSRASRSGARLRRDYPANRTPGLAPASTNRASLSPSRRSGADLAEAIVAGDSTAVRHTSLVHVKSSESLALGVQLPTPKPFSRRLAIRASPGAERASGDGSSGRGTPDGLLSLISGNGSQAPSAGSGSLSAGADFFLTVKSVRCR
ncbi:unnamed protein product [Protopolystoma xenopodis]|uniref:Uncharacterized protein n=1 Tax=Protopolystoma xenopodis TaxID=117903 RepID=A0A448XHE1_9PLAT|nr:unnamed protein product [Protopolystoma xenopodis]